MADTKISALTAVTTPAGATEIPVNEAGTSKKLTLTQLNAYIEPIFNNNTATQVLPSSATENYITASGIIIPQTRIKAGSLYRCTLYVTKTAAGTATPIGTLRIGTAGTIADTARGSWGTTAQTAAADNMRLMVEALFYSVGSGTSAVVRTNWAMQHNLSATGFATVPSTVNSVASSGFDSTPAGSQIGVSLASGATGTPVWTITSVFAELLNLT